VARKDVGCERLMSVPGIGPIISSATVSLETPSWQIRERHGIGRAWSLSHSGKAHKVKLRHYPQLAFLECLAYNPECRRAAPVPPIRLRRLAPPRFTPYGGAPINGKSPTGSCAE